MTVPCVCVTTHSREALGLSKVLFHIADYDDLEQLEEDIKKKLSLTQYDEYIYSYYDVPRRLQDKWKLHSELFDFVEGIDSCGIAEEDPYIAFCEAFDDYSYKNFRERYIGTNPPDSYEEGVRMLDAEPWLDECPNYLQPYLSALYESYGEDNSEYTEYDGYYFYDED